MKCLTAASPVENVQHVEDVNHGNWQYILEEENEFISLKLTFHQTPQVQGSGSTSIKHKEITSGLASVSQHRAASTGDGGWRLGNLDCSTVDVLGAQVVWRLWAGRRRPRVDADQGNWRRLGRPPAAAAQVRETAGCMLATACRNRIVSQWRGKVVQLLWPLALPLLHLASVLGRGHTDFFTSPRHRIFALRPRRQHAIKLHHERNYVQDFIPMLCCSLQCRRRSSLKQLR